MNVLTSLENQLLVTKFYVPVTLGPLISRPRLTALLNEGLKCSLVLVSASAGFGKTTLLSTWCQSLPPNNPRVAWVSLDEEDNEPRLFWTYVLTALSRQLPEYFTPLLAQLQSPQVSPLKHILAVLINLLAESTDHFLLILDDYQVISEQQVHTTLAYLIEHLPPQLRIVLATRANPPLPLPLLRARKQALEVRTDQLRCTTEETRAFLHEVMGIQLPDETIQEVTDSTGGWLVGLQLLGLSLPEQVGPLTLLKEISGNQRYILDYLTQEVLQRQPQELQRFLLSTCILDQLSAPLCDAVIEQSGSQQILQRIEQANLFVVSLDSKRQWYRYHGLFAEALRHQLERMYPDLVPTLHHRASLWYAQHGQPTQAILYALRAKEWPWVADLIEQKSQQLMAFTWGVSEHQLVTFQHWLEQLPIEIIETRPRLCLACAHMLWTVAPCSLLDAWLDAANRRLTALLTAQASDVISTTVLAPHARQEQENLLGEVIAWRAFLWSQVGDGRTALSLCQKALSLLLADNCMFRAQVAVAEVLIYYASINDAVIAIQRGQQAIFLAQTGGQHALTISIIGATAVPMLAAGQLHSVLELTKQAMLLGKQSEGRMLPEVSWSSVWQAEVLWEWNKLTDAHALVREAILRAEQSESIGSLIYLLYGYMIQLRIFLSYKELDAARSTLKQIEDIGRRMNQPVYVFCFSHTFMIDQVKLWLACGELDRAIHWAKERDIAGQSGIPLSHEREEVAYAYILLAKKQPTLALERLEPVLQRAAEGQRWSHVIEIRLLQALAYQMSQEETEALNTLSEAVHLAEPEGYIRRFVDEGAPMESLLYRLRRRNRKHGPTPYLDTLLAAFQQETRTCVQTEEPTKVYQLPEPLSEREREVLQLLASGASNQEIAQELVIVVDTVKRHVSHIFSKLGAHNRMQAVLQARELGLLGEKGG
ncbi:MAG TPA: LuxR C-terminal-related transcriptional regulator [Ktedonobacteraceae bacterium]|jgi:LuxR family maltose regulon positive regulatory protein